MSRAPVGMAGERARVVLHIMWSLVLGLWVLGAQAQGNSPTVSVAITSPANAAVITYPGNVALGATASVNRSNWPILEVDFYSGSTLIGTATSAPYTITWANLAAGTYTVTAQAIATNPGQAKQNTPGPTWSRVSAPVTFRVNAPPTMSISSPATGAVFNLPSNITVTANAADSDGSIAKVEFYAGSTLIGTATTAPYSLSWSPGAGSYSVTARATDNDGAVTTSSTITLRVNAPPTVSIGSPATGAVFNPPAAISVTANAADSDGTIAKVEFYSGSTLIGTATSTPYTVTWSNPGSGSYTLTARASDNDGAVTTSSSAALRVNAAPTVSITNPSAGAVLNGGPNITVTANATDSDGTVTMVDFYQLATLIGTATSAPYSITWANPAPGSYSLRAAATDNNGATTISSPVSVRVNAPPTVSLTAPVTGASFTAPASIAMSGTAADSDGTITRVEVWQGATLLATLSSPPYTYTWNNVPAGSYSLTAKAIDNDGAITTSATVTVTVKSVTAQMYFIHVDHLNTPRLIADSTGTTVWRWDQDEPFGSIPPNDNPSGVGAFDFPLRFPGQYYDRETNLNYNYFRDYDPSIGRYVESDPVGLKSGLNTYAYVGQDPLGGVDPLGLVKVHGNWCGPDWTGGYKKEWNQLTPNEQQHAKLPIDPIDVSCMKHDKCYASCRAKLPCSPDGRSACFGDCDLTLYAEVYSQGFTGYAVGTAMAREGKRNPGLNAANCPNCPKP